MVLSDQPHNIFVSYSHRDVSDVDAIVDHMEKAGYRVWIDRKARGAANRYAGAIVSAIKSSNVVTLMSSRHSLASDHVVREIYVAGDFKKPFLVCQLDDCDFPDEVLYFITGFPRVPASDQQRLIAEVGRFVS